MKTGRSMEPLSKTFCLCAFLLVLFSCTVGPDYKRPDVADITPSEWGWKIAEPGDTVPKGEWWSVFKDPALDGLESLAVANNQNLREAVARVDEARSVARISRSGFFPELSLDPSVSRQRTSANQPTPIQIPPPFKLSSVNLNTFSAPLDLSYEVDLWGRVRRSFESAQTQAQASISDYQNVLLTLTADVAVNYFLIRSLDSEIAILQRTVDLRRESVRILSERFNIGTISEIDAARARTELASSKSDLADTVRRRTETLNALALLCGRPASSFEIAESKSIVSLPVIPAGLPSSVLERRPDISRAERTLAARNAQIGVAKAAYFPVLNLTGQAGYLSSKADSLFTADSKVWSAAAGISLPVFTGGRTAAQVSQAEAVYQEALSEYRQTVLTAFKEVEDSLAQIVLRNEQAGAQDEAVTSAGRVADLIRVRYDAGTVTYLEVVDADRTLLQQQRLRAQLAGQQFAASVRLIKALGGGWNVSAIPAADNPAGGK